MQEKEYKIILSEEKYNNLYEKIRWSKEFIQKNYYYDSSSLQLYQQGITCRIRQISNQYFLQIKYPDTSKLGLFKIRNEKEFTIEGIKNSMDLPEELRKELKINSELVLLGPLVTERKEYYLSDNVTVFLDYNKYFNASDYELEIEFKDSDKDIAYFLSEYGLDLIPVKYGKYERFIQRYKEVIKGE